MKSLLFCSLVLLPVVALFAGCSRPPKPLDVKLSDTGTKTPTNIFRQAHDAFRYPENPRTSDDWTRFREGFALLTAHFAKPEVQARLRLPPEDRKFLESEVHLTSAELIEVEAPALRTADAHYLDECYLLRDALRAIDLADANIVKQAEGYFAWVMRNVFLHQQIDDWVPPAFTLRRGYGSALERSLVFLALLRQAHIEGCLIVAPDTDPLQFLVAVLERGSDQEQGKLHLFDARLGMALQAKDQKSVLTLKDALAEPALLQAAQITPEQAKKLEAWLVCPLYALSPRMLELQKGLNAFDVNLYLNAPQLHQEISKVANLPVKVWNAPAQGQTLPNSPTRCLSLFLPKQEGGHDESKRVEAVTRARIPVANVMANFAQINVTNPPLPLRVFQTLLALSDDFFNKYELQPREMYLHGNYEPLIRRQERLQVFTRDDSLVRVALKPEFRKELAEWENAIIAANALANDDKAPPEHRAKAQQFVRMLGTNDSFIDWLLRLDNEKRSSGQADPEKNPREREFHQKTILTKILAVGFREYLDLEMARSQAASNHEKAVSAQAAPPNPATLKKANDAWNMARISWSNFYLDGIALKSVVEQRLEQIRRRGDVEIEMKINLLESLHLDVHKYFQAKFRLAECIAHENGEKAARVYLERIQGEIEEFQKKGQLQAEIRNSSDSLQRIPPNFRFPLQKRLDLLGRDWSEHGSYFWMRRQIEQRLASPQRRS